MDNDLFGVERWPKIAAVARTLGVEDEALKKWRQRRKVPGNWQIPLLRACVEAGVTLSAEEIAPKVAV